MSSRVARPWLRAAAPQGIGALLLACHSAAPPQSPTPAADITDTPTPEAAEPEPLLALHSTSSAENSAQEDERTVADVEAERRKNAPPQRQITYRVTPEGLQVELQGMTFKPRARAVKTKDGGWTIELSLDAASKQNEIYALLTPKHGPLSIAGTLQTKAGAKLAFGDARDGDGEELIVPGSSGSFRRAWPEGSVWANGGKPRPAYWNEKVHLDVGLWGFGVAGERRLPVKKLFTVEMTAGAKPEPVIKPPEL